MYKKMKDILYAKRLLESYSTNKAAEENFPYEIMMINSRLYSAVGERTMVDLIEAKDRLATRTEKAVNQIRQTERGLSALNQYQKELLTAFYITKAHAGAEELAERFSVERSTVYRDKNKALSVFARAI